MISYFFLVYQLRKPLKHSYLHNDNLRSSKEFLIFWFKWPSTSHRKKYEEKEFFSGKL